MSAVDSFRARVLRLAEERGLNQTSLADRCGIDGPQFSKLLGGKRTLREDHVAAVAAALGVPVAELEAGPVAPATIGRTADEAARVARQISAARGAASACRAEVAGLRAEAHSLRESLNTQIIATAEALARADALRAEIAAMRARHEAEVAALEETAP